MTIQNCHSFECSPGLGVSTDAFYILPNEHIHLPMPSVLAVATHACQCRLRDKKVHLFCGLMFELPFHRGDELRDGSRLSAVLVELGDLVGEQRIGDHLTFPRL